MESTNRKEANMTLSNTDINGRPVQVGDIVVTRYGKARVHIVEEPVAGTRATKDGVRTLYVKRHGNADGPYGSEFYVVRADRVEVVA